MRRRAFEESFTIAEQISVLNKVFLLPEKSFLPSDFLLPGMTEPKKRTNHPYLIERLVCCSPSVCKSVPYTPEVHWCNCNASLRSRNNEGSESQFLTDLSYKRICPTRRGSMSCPTDTWASSCHSRCPSLCRRTGSTGCICTLKKKSKKSPP